MLAVLKPTAEKTSRENGAEVIKNNLIEKCTILLRNARISAVEIYKESTHTITIHNECVYLSKLKPKNIGLG